MSYSCANHGWQHAQQPCPQCNPPQIMTTTGAMSNPTESRAEILERIWRNRTDLRGALREAYEAGGSSERERALEEAAKIADEAAFNTSLGHATVIAAQIRALKGA